MTSHELHSKVQLTKSFLNRESVRNKLNSPDSVLSFREIGIRMDMIHEAERIGVRNLNERENRKLTRMIAQLEEMADISAN